MEKKQQGHAWEDAGSSRRAQLGKASQVLLGLCPFTVGLLIKGPGARGQGSGVGGGEVTGLHGGERTSTRQAAPSESGPGWDAGCLGTADYVPWPPEATPGRFLLCSLYLTRECGHETREMTCRKGTILNY